MLPCSLALLVFAIDTDIDICRYELFLPADFVIPNGRIRPIQLPFGVFVLVIVITAALVNLQCTRLPVAIYSTCTPDDGWDCHPKHVE